MRQRLIFLLILSIMLLNACASIGVQAYHDGNRAFVKGDYKTSFANYLFAAHQRVVPAQYALAYQYFYGLGTKQDTVKSIHWLQRAASNSPQARYALHVIEQHGVTQPWTYQFKSFESQ